jgi:membrane fusion protein (multidrug efflux system)
MSSQSLALEANHPIQAEPARNLVPSPSITPVALPKTATKGGLRRVLLAGAAVALLAAASLDGREYWSVGRFLVSTDDAYVKADNTTIAPKVSGYLSEVAIGDNEHVKAG